MSDYTYCNLQISYTNGLTNGQQMVEAKGTAIYTQPLLLKPTDYYGCVSRLKVDMFNNPLLVPRIRVGQNNVNLTLYNFQMVYNNAGTLIYSDPVPVYYVPSNQYEPIPKPPVVKQDISSGYYYTYDYNSIILMFNTAITASLANLKTKPASAGINQIQNATAPYLVFDSTTGLSLKAPSTYFNYTPNTNFNFTNGFNALLFNQDLETFFNGIQVNRILNTSGDPIVCDNVFCLYDRGNNLLNNVYTSQIQSLEEMCYWQSIQTIQVQTSMSIVSEYAQGSSNDNKDGQTSQFISMLTDFQIDPSSTGLGGYHTILSYNKVENIRLFNFTSDIPIYKVDCQLYWSDRYNNTYPLFISPRVSVNIKYEFIKKHIFNTYYAQLKLNGIKY